MSTQKRKRETEDNKTKKQKTEFATSQSELTENEKLDLEPPITNCGESNIEDCVADNNDEQTSKYYFSMIGEHENQVSEGGEADLPKYMKYCKKNPGHLQFIPIETFCVKHIHEVHQDNDLFEFIKAVADLTVKISVKITSPERPEFWPNSKRPYHLSDLRGKKTLRTGSGWVCNVIKHTDEDEKGVKRADDDNDDDIDDDIDDDDTVTMYDDYQTCPCDKCKASDRPSKVWWEIHVDTAAHVVVDDIEASHTTLTLFYDREDSDVVILKDKVCVGYLAIEHDRCALSCVTCDENLANKLLQMKTRFKELSWKVNEKHHCDVRDDHKLNFIVSHPHGCPKRVSVGQWKDMARVGERDDDTVCEFAYTTCTCPGSSGAPVHCVGYGWVNNLIHSGSLKHGLNHSGSAYFPQ